MKKEDLWKASIFAAIAILFLLAFMFLKPEITGFAVFSPGYYNWTFESDNYVYDSSLILIENNSARLKLQTQEYSWTTSNSTEIYIENGYYDYDNKTSEVINIDSNNYVVSANKIFDIAFGDFLDNNDVITMHTKSSSANNIKLCKASEVCNENNYGSVDYNGSEGEFSITISNLEHSSKSFSIITNGSTKIDFISSTKGNIINAQYDPNDKTSKLTSVDNDDLDVAKKKMFNVIFGEGLQNNDIISLYLDNEGETNIYLCWAGDFCESNYGSMHFPNIQGWYNITISNLPSSTSRLAILTDDKFDVDYIKVIREWEEENTGINLTYPDSASLETQTFELPTINQLNLFSKNDELKGQSIKYYYYNENWIEIPSNGSLPELEQIKLKAEFFSNKTETPILHNMVLSYDFCSENWECSEWDACQENGARIRECTDKNQCGSFVNKPNEIDGCDYFPGYYEINESKLISIGKDNITVINAGGVVIDLITNDNIVGSNFEIEKNLNLTEASGKKMVSNVNISIDGINEKLESGIIRLYYTDEYLAENNINEDSLKIYYYGENWEELNSTVNKEENYVYANAEHFSVYGILGEVKSESSPSSSGSSGGSSGGHSSTSSVIVNQQMPTEIKETTKEIPKEIINGNVETNAEKNSAEEISGNTFDSLTVLVVYNAKKAPVSVPIGIGLLVLMIIFFLRVAKFNRKK